MYEFAEKGKEKNADFGVLGANSSTGRKNRTGIPTRLKERIESNTGVSLDDVQVHYNSDRPARLDALAYTKGNQVEVGPGQEHHLPHELGHVVQQKLGIVRSNARHPSGEAMNTDVELEKQADAIGDGKRVEAIHSQEHGVAQRMGNDVVQGLWTESFLMLLVLLGLVSGDSESEPESKVNKKKRKEEEKAAEEEKAEEEEKAAEEEKAEEEEKVAEEEKAEEEKAEEGINIQEVLEQLEKEYQTNIKDFEDDKDKYNNDLKNLDPLKEESESFQKKYKQLQDKYEQMKEAYGQLKKTFMDTKKDYENEKEEFLKLKQDYENKKEEFLKLKKDQWEVWIGLWNKKNLISSIVEEAKRDITYNIGMLISTTCALSIKDFKEDAYYYAEGIQDAIRTTTNFKNLVKKEGNSSQFSFRMKFEDKAVGYYVTATKKLRVLLKEDNKDVVLFDAYPCVTNSTASGKKLTEEIENIVKEYKRNSQKHPHVSTHNFSDSKFVKDHTQAEYLKKSYFFGDIETDETIKATIDVNNYRKSGKTDSGQTCHIFEKEFAAYIGYRFEPAHILEVEWSEKKDDEQVGKWQVTKIQLLRDVENAP